MHLSREGDTFVLESEQWVPRPVAEVFDFFSRAENLERITPPFLGFRVKGMSTPAIEEGTLIDYRLRIHGVPVGWRTRIEEWVPGERFVDVQLRGPYALWHHTHTFAAENGGTRMRDRVRFRLPLGALGRLVAGALVRRDVSAIFAYRSRVISDLFPPKA
ncbi:MAG: SRPBCC family protein [Bdellovibrionales bacterium]|nr:SRPBCC family protein [Bdellovibrionales bacterium]